jgi:hypothetical protein
MANVTVKTRFKRYLPGAGFTNTGTVVQGKVEMWGRIDIAAYTPGGEPLTAAQLGLTTLDHISFTSITPDSAAAAPAGAIYDWGAGTVLVYSNLSTDAGAGQLGAAAAALTFHAVGDSAMNVELV